MKPDQITIGKTYVGGKNRERRTVVGYGAHENWIRWGQTRDRLPYGGFVSTRVTSRASFAKWARCEEGSAALDHPHE